MANKRPHRKSRRHFDDTSILEVVLTPINPGIGPTFIEIEAPFHAEFVKRIKTLPAQERYWNPKIKVWGIMDKHQPFILGLIGAVWHGNAKITFSPTVNPNSNIERQKVLVKEAMVGFQDDNMDSLRLT